MTIIFLAHACIDGMLMFRVPIPLGAGFAAVGRSIWGAYETAVNERNVNPEAIKWNDSLILGRQVIHILPEGSAILNPERQSFCLDQSRAEAKLPIVINATSPIEIDILRVDLETSANETIHISKSQIKTMHKEASRLISYSENPNEPKTFYFSVKKPGLYVLEKVVDESNLEVSRKKLAHTVVVPCPKAALTSSGSHRCKGELSNVELEVTGTPPMKVKYRKMVNTATQEATFESIQPEDLSSPLVKQDHNAIILPNRIETYWAKPRTVRVPLSEGLGTIGKWVYAIDEVVDGFGNVAVFSDREHEGQERHSTKYPPLHQIIDVHDRPSVKFQGCSPQHPLKVAKGELAKLPVHYSSTSRNELANAIHNLDYVFTPQGDISLTGEHSNGPQEKTLKVKNPKDLPQIREAGLYTLVGVSTEFCKGDILEPASCVLQNPPEPSLSLSEEEIFDKCAGSPIGLRVDLDLVGTPPFEVHYRMLKDDQRHHKEKMEKIPALRGQIELTPEEAGAYSYEFYQINDAVYRNQPLKNLNLKQNVKPSASARFGPVNKKALCIDERATFEILMQGEAPFSIEYELQHAGKRSKTAKHDITDHEIKIETDPLSEGGEYTLTLLSITDRMGCKEFLKDEAKVKVRPQKPKAKFGQFEGRRSIDVLDGKRAELPLRLEGEAPWTIKFLDRNGKEQNIRVSEANGGISVDQDGTYELVDISDVSCPGVVDDLAKEFQVNRISRPELRVSPNDIQEHKDSALTRADVCEGDEDAVEILFKGLPPYHVHYIETLRPEHGAPVSKAKEFRAAMSVATLRMDTLQAGSYEYKLSELQDANYGHSAKHFTPLIIKQKVHPRPSMAFTNPGKTYAFCSVESDGEEVIPIKLHGQPPFDIEVEIKHHGSIRSEILQHTAIQSSPHNIRIPHNKLHLGRSTVSLRRISDGRGCSRSLDSTTPRVQISVQDAPTITSLESQDDYCIGDRLNFGLSGVAPFTVFYDFEGKSQKPTISSGNTFRRYAEKPGTFKITGVQDSASSCRANVNITKRIHGMPSARVSHGKESYIDIHEGGHAEIFFEFGGVPPFEFSYTRSSNTEKGGRKGVVLDMRSEISEEHTMRVLASEEGTYEVVAIKDKHCAYTKPGVKVDRDSQKRIA